MVDVRDPPMAGALSDEDLFLARHSLVHGRIRRVVDSWLPPPDAFPDSQQVIALDDSFKTSTDVGGLGSIIDTTDGASIDGSMPRRTTSNDKVLEIILGKKAAEARRKAQQQKSSATAKHGNLNPITRKSPTKPRDSDDEEEGGRAGAFTSRIKRDVQRPAKASSVAETDLIHTVDYDTYLPRDTTTETMVVSVQRSLKRKAGGSYLDEILGKRGKKKQSGKGSRGRDNPGTIR